MSIRFRLTIWYTAVLAAMLILFGLAMYSLLGRVMYAQLEDDLQSRTDQITNYLRTRADPLRMLITRQVELPPVDVFSSPDIFVQIVDAKGEVVARSANLGTRYMPLDKTSFDANLEGKDVLFTLVAGGARLRIYSAPLQVIDPLQGETVIGSVQVGKSLVGIDYTLQAVRYVLLLGIAVTLIIAAGIGAFMSHKALSPIDKITGAALQITRAEDLSGRLPQTQTQDEVARLTDTFNEMLGRLEALFRSQQQFVADVSHELRTPLTTLRGNLDLLKRGRVDLSDEDMGEMLAAMEGEITRMSRLVSDLLLLAKSDAGVQVERRPVEMDTVLLEAYRQALLMADGVRINLGHEDQAVVLGDQDRLQQLLLNLVDNAIKYTPAGGEVTLSLYKQGGWVQVAVSDTGIGIAPEDEPHIFERFYRANRGRPRQPGGTGLGLSIARWIAEAHGGYLTVESQVGKGSTFTLWLAPHDPASEKADERGHYSPFQRGYLLEEEE